MTTFFRSLLPGLALSAGLLTPSFAAPQLYSKDPVLHPHPPGFAYGEAKDVVTGQLTSDIYADLAVLQGTDIVLMHTAARHEAWLKLSGSFDSLAVLPASGSSTSDTLLAIDATGLVRVHWNGAGLEKDAQFTPVSSWIGASSLQVTPIGNSFYITALAASGNQLLQGEWKSSKFIARTTVNLPGQVLTYAALEFDSTLAGAELAVDDGNGLNVYSGAGATLYTLANAGNAPLTRRFAEPGASNDALLWVTSVPGTQDLVHMFGVVRQSASGPVHEPFLPLPGYRVHDVVLADYFGEGFIDLIGLSLDSDDVYVFKNQWAVNSAPLYTFYLPGPKETFQIDGSDVYVSGAPAPAIGAGDLDNDGDADLVLAGHETGSANLGVYLSDGIDETTQSPQLLGCTTYSETLDPGGATVSTSLHFNIQPPVVGSGATHIVTAVWVQPDAQSPVNPAASFVEVNQVGSGSIDTNVLFTLPTAGQEIFHAQFWTITEVGGVTLSAGPATTWWKPRSELVGDPVCFQDPGSSGGYNTPPNIRPGSQTPYTP